MKLRKWEIALMIALMTTLALAYAAEAAEQRLADKLVRLHVIAEGDSPQQQALKLEVRDAVLAVVEAPMQNAHGREQAEKTLTSLLPDIERAALDCVTAHGLTLAVHAELADGDFPTKEYDTFALPAGEYFSLRVILGEGQGQNWWCVVFPPLCMTASMEELDEAAQTAGISREEQRLITRDGESYVIRFKLAEWWGQIKKKLKG